MKNPVTLIILDGYGIAPAGPGNAVTQASTPNLDRYFADFPHTTLSASGGAVGLPDGQMGNSEVGHANIGAGRIVYQDLTRITKQVADGDFYENSELRAVLRHCKEHGTALHLMGLLSDGGVHSHNTHLWALLRAAKDAGLTEVFIHAFLDGRDVPPQSGEGFVRECAAKCAELSVGQIATVMGRYYAMDRDNRWERVSEAYQAMVMGEGIRNADPAAAVKASYDEGITDEFVKPVVCADNACISENDGVIFFNFRPDRAREITRTLVDPDFTGFPREKGFFPLYYVCMTRYDASMPNVHVAFEPQSLTNIFAEYIASLGYTQLRIAETEKYAHVTFFFNGGDEQVFPGEDRVLIPSPKVATYDLKPEMSAYEVAEEACRRIGSGEYDVVILNFANGDMVGHTGVMDAAVKAVETIDACTKMVVDKVSEMGGFSLITADHGNAEQMTDADGGPFTAHTTNLVPFAIIGAEVTLSQGRLCDIAPTMLDLMGLEKPADMTGQSLIV